MSEQWEKKMEAVRGHNYEQLRLLCKQLEKRLEQETARADAAEERLDAAASLLPMWKGSAQTADGCMDDLECVLTGEMEDKP